MIQSVNRIFDIIESLATEKNGLRLGEVAARVRLKVSTVHNLLGTALYRSYVEQDKETSRYRLGKKCFWLAQNYSKNDRLLSAAKEPIKLLSDQCGELVFLGAIINDDLICLVLHESNQPLAVNPNQNWKNKFHVTAAGKVLLAYAAPDDFKHIRQKHGFVKFTNKTMTNPNKLKVELAKIRGRGYAIVKDEGILGVSSVGVPIREEDDSVAYSLSVSLPTASMSADRQWKLIRLLKETAQAISGNLYKEEEKK